MKLEDVVRAINKKIDIRRENSGIESKASLVVHREIKQASSVAKAYKEYSVRIWYIDRVKDVRKTCLMMQHTTKEDKEKVIQELDLQMLEYLINFIGSTFYDKIVKGEFDGYENE